MLSVPLLSPVEPPLQLPRRVGLLGRAWGALLVSEGALRRLRRGNTRMHLLMYASAPAAEVGSIVRYVHNAYARGLEIAR